MKAEDPLTGKTFYFVDKNLPFGASISCALFTAFSESLRHLIEFRVGRAMFVTNYLDDFLFIARDEQDCNHLVRSFLHLCEEIGCPVALEKTEWACSTMVFLGILLDGTSHRLCIPVEKKLKAVNQINWILGKKKATVKEIQCLTGLLNFLNKALIPGRAFTRRMYTNIQTVDKHGRELKLYHHIKLNEEFKSDFKMWLIFLDHNNPRVLCRPFVDSKAALYAKDVGFYTDASGKVGLGCWFKRNWIALPWDEQFLRDCKPSIAYLELYALVVGIITWADKLVSTKVILHCDNKSVRDMVNHFGM